MNTPDHVKAPWCRLMWHLAALIAARRGPAWPGACRRWLPGWLPTISPRSGSCWRPSACAPDPTVGPASLRLGWPAGNISCLLSKHRPISGLDQVSCRAARGGLSRVGDSQLQQHLRCPGVHQAVSAHDPGGSGTGLGCLLGPPRGPDDAGAGPGKRRSRRRPRPCPRSRSWMSTCLAQGSCRRRRSGGSLGGNGSAHRPGPARWPTGDRPRNTDDLGVRPLLVFHPENPDWPGGDPAAREDRVFQQYQGIEGVTVLGERVRDEPVVGRVDGR